MITLLGGLVLVAGSLMPWTVITSGFSTITFSALDHGGDGVIFLACGVATICIAVARLLSSAPPIIHRLPTVIGALAGVLIAVDLSRPATWGVNPDPDILSADRGAGAYMLVVGAIVTIVGGVIVGVTGRHPSDAGAPVRIKLAVGALLTGVLGGVVLVSGVLYTAAILLALLAILLGVEAFIGSYKHAAGRRGVVAGGLVLVSLVLGIATLVGAVPALNDAKLARFWIDENGQRHRYWMDNHGNLYR